MSRPSARVGRNRRRTFLYLPLLIVGAQLVFAAAPLIDGRYVLGAVIMLIAAGGFILDDTEAGA